ncbi:Respiratory supercomplex factor 1, mitochondrial [Madurella mycetomatis]|uniref:Respiratory supercomplex factor 1, mitochondrial n=1 Tax=Madurella mycetomatis TaxID=100816 RepID=A0A175VSS0_9PEZI|nr:Respiratory supercomplex factor 1, mitochondrial [Madurella mycetomatis]KXX74567.1 Respiratory supercomplex factor 1, mitochondrial [Madurella mycetomatis]
MSDRPLSSRPLPSSFEDDEEFYNESGRQKILRKLKEEPLVPFGALLTVAAFTSAYRASRKGDHHKVQRMFRARVAAQAFTVVAMVAGGAYYAEDRNKTRERHKQEQQKRAEEHHQKWIRELEARDAEEKEFLEKLEKRRKRAAEKAGLETGTDGVAAQARAALKEAKGVKDAKEEKQDATNQNTTQKPIQTPDSQAKPESAILTALGGWLAGSRKTPEEPTQRPGDQKPDSEATRK